MKDGIINLLKPAGMTSHDGVQLLRRLTGVKRVGHTGTLDPMAVGVLPICIGKATRIMEYLELDYKEYRCEMQLGLTTDTQDVWGNVLSQEGFQQIKEKEISDALASLEGDIEQLPPGYSAVKVKGRKLYEYARKGIEVQVEKRPVHIKSIHFIHFNREEGRAVFDVICSKGTYVRTLCHDVGQMLGCGAAMSWLIRMSSGEFSIEDTVTIEDLLVLRQGEDVFDEKTKRYLHRASIEATAIEPYRKEPDFPLTHFGRAYVNENRARWFLNGGYLEEKDITVEKIPSFEAAAKIKNWQRFAEAYNIYCRSRQQEALFLGVAIYKKTINKLLADKVFLKASELT